MFIVSDLKEKVRTKKAYYIVGIILVICVFIGVSYALWTLSFNQEDTNMLASDCFQLTFTEDTEAISLDKAYPITDEEGKTLTPYTFTITNQCSAYASYQINLEVLDSSTLSRYEAIKVELNEDTPVLLSSNEVVKTTLDNAVTSFKLKTGYLDHNESVSYDLRLWMDENITMEDTDVMNTSFASKITITASYIDHMPSDYELCVEKYGSDSIQCSILADADTEGCPTVNADGTVQVTSAEDTNGYLCSAPDDYGTSYYYRGNVENNWVKFGGYYWRIIRINGDGSIRMIYAGDASVIDALPNKNDVLKNGYNDGSTDYTQIGTSAYNAYYTGNAYVGYMYGENVWGEPETSESTSSLTLNNYYYYYADSYTFDTATGTYTLTNPTQEVWSEALVGKYICASTSTSCTTMLVIDSYYDSSQAYVYSYTRTSVEGGYEENHGTSRSRRELASNYYYGTGYTFNKTTGEFRLTDYTSSVYDGSQVGKYTCAISSSSCTTLYYLESENTTTTANAYTISRTGTTYDDTHANITNSTIKGKVDEWYETNLLGTEYERYITDTLFCNDRSFNSSNSGTGTGASTTIYRGKRGNVKQLTCPNQNDRFTVDDEVIGNGDLTYPIGLVNIDEVYLAGGYSDSNSGYYLYTGNVYRTMSPSQFGMRAFAFIVYSDGKTAGDFHYVYSSDGVRPVINLKAESLKSGDGTANNPFMVGA